MTDRRILRRLLRTAYLLPLVLSACSSDGPGNVLDPFVPESDSAVSNPDASAAADGGGFPFFDANGFLVDASALDAGQESDATAGDAAVRDGGADAALDASGDANVAADASGGDAAVGDAGAYPYVRGAAPSSDSASKTGPYTVQSYTSGYRAGTQFGDATVFYPTNAQAPFTIVTLAPDEYAQDSTLAPWARFLASHGIVAMVATANVGLMATDELASQALLDALTSLKAENTRTDSPLRGKLDVERAALLGTAVGAGGALIAAAAHPELKAVVSLFAQERKTFKTNKVPAILIASQADIYGQGLSRPIYDDIPNDVSKLLYDLDTGSASIATDPANANGSLGRYGLSWLKLFLEGDERYKPFLLVRPEPVADYRTNLQ